MKKKSYRILHKYFALIVFIMISALPVYSQIRRVVNVNSYLTPPYPVYLSDYVTTGSEKLRVSMLFQDPDEPSWDVYLKIKLESNKVKIESKPDFRPQNPITLNTGILKWLSGNELFEYFDYNNLNISGISRKDLEQTGGRLPEGFYTLTIEACSYLSGGTMSNISMNIFHISLYDAPIIISPVSGSIIKPSNLQNITFQWQLPLMADQLSVKYKVHLYEIIDPYQNPENAIANGTALELFTSEELSFTSFQYDITKPLLEPGKKYAFFIEAYQNDGRILFKNNGLSEVKWFNYGYPTGGKIEIDIPEPDYAYSLRDNKIFRWLAPDNIISNQQYYYKFKIVELEDDQLPEDGIENNLEYYTYQSNNITSHFGHEVLYSQRFNSMKAYAWQVNAYSEDTEIAESEVRKFYGPPLMEAFKAGNHIIEVDRIFSTDVNNLRGEGRVRISPTEKIKVIFEDVRLALFAGEWTLQKGEVKADISERDPIQLNPEYKYNGIANFYPEKLSITKEDGLRLFGVIKWELPLEVDSPEKVFVKSEPDWFNYDLYRLIGISKVDKETREFDLINPMGFKIVLNDKANFLLRGKNNFVLRFEGDVFLPKSVKSEKPDRLSIGFKEQQLFYLQGQRSYISIFPVSNVRLELIPNSYVFDFSEVVSPGRFEVDPEWKGFYVNTFSTAYHVDFEKSKQLSMKEKILFDSELEKDDSVNFWISSTGLDFKQRFESNNITNSFFNTFPAEMSIFEVNVEKGKFISGQVKGSIIIPVISEKEKHNFTVSMNNNGFVEGFLDKSLENKEFVFNPDGGEQKINIKILQAVFTDNERFDMAIDFEWPSLDIKMEGLNYFKIWGNYDIGFVKPNGTIALTKQVSGKIREFPITVNLIGCGSNRGIYSFGINAIVDLGNDVAGADGPPQSNLYSIVQNKFLGEFIPKPQVPAEEENGTSTGTQTPASTSPSGFVSPTSIDEGFNDEDYEKVFKDWKEDKKAEVVDDISKYYEDIEIDEDNSIDPNTWTYNDGSYESNNSSSDSLNIDFSFETDFSPENLHALMEDLVEMMPDEYYDEAVAVKEGIMSLEERYQINVFDALTNVDSIMALILKREYDKIINDLLKPIQDVTDSTNKMITQTINTVRDMANKGVTDVTESIIDGIADEVKELTDEKDIKELITEAADGVKKIVTGEITGRINLFVKEQITKPVTEGIVGKVTGIIQDSIRSQLTTIGYRIIDDNFEADLDDVINIDRIFQSLDDEVFASLFNADSVTDAIDAAKVAFLEEYLNPGEVFDTLFEQIAQAGLEYISDEIKDAITEGIIDGVTDALDEEAGEVAAVILKNIGENIELDFSNLDDKIREGRFDEIVKFDPTTINIKTDIVEVTGRIELEGDSIYGDVFKGELDVLVKVPKPFLMKAKYINGKVNDMNYWFAGIGHEGMKGEGDTDADKLPAMVPLGPVGLAKASGKVYHHMSVTGNSEVPDPMIDYGANLQLTVYDMFTGGEQIALVLEGNYISESTGDYTMYFKGTLDIGNSGASIANGEVTISYNSAEEHFLGDGIVIVENPGVLCAEGHVIVDLKPDEWLVSIGSEEERIEFVPACFGWSPTGWLVVTQRDLDLGLGLSFSSYAKSPYIDIFGTKYAGYADFGFAAGIQVIIIYKPSIKLQEASVWAEAWAEFGIEKKKGSKKSHWVIAEALLSGKATVKFEPLPIKAEGYLKGSCKICFIKVRFEMDYSMTL